MDDEFLGHELEEWYPMEPTMGPPLPRWLNIFWPWYKPTAAQFKVSNLVIAPPEVGIGEIVTISCTATNIGSEAGDYTVKLGGDFVAQEQVTLSPGESKVISFTVTPTVAKTYVVTIDGLSGTFKATAAPPPGADIRIENLTISPAEVQVGQAVQISCTATNYGGAAGSKTITCTVV